METCIQILNYLIHTCNQLRARSNLASGKQQTNQPQPATTWPGSGEPGWLIRAWLATYQNQSRPKARSNTTRDQRNPARPPKQIRFRAKCQLESNQPSRMRKGQASNGSQPSDTPPVAPPHPRPLRAQRHTPEPSRAPGGPSPGAPGHQLTNQPRRHAPAGASWCTSTEPTVARAGKP
jgi:hypothetical protein